MQRLVLFNPRSSSATAEIRDLIRDRLAGATWLELADEQGLGEVPDALASGAGDVVVVGGDGTVSSVARIVAGSERRLGIIPAGLQNNFARSLGIPLDVEEALQAVLHPDTGKVTLGRIGSSTFIEAGSVGVFGDLIALGEEARQLRFGELAAHLADLPPPLTFRYKVSGDVLMEGEALSLIAANTPSIGAQIPVADKDPLQPWLELRVIGALGQVAETRWVDRVLVDADPPIDAYADVTPAGRTPLEIAAWPGALTVLLPPPAPSELQPTSGPGIV